MERKISIRVSEVSDADNDGTPLIGETEATVPPATAAGLLRAIADQLDPPRATLRTGGRGIPFG